MSEALEISENSAIEQHLNWPTPDNGEGGEPSPIGVSYGKSMMWYFLLSDAFTFTAFLAACLAIRASSPWWPNANDVFNSIPLLEGVKAPMGFVTIMTSILILSSVFIVRAVQEGHRMNKKGVAIWLVGGIIGGILFLGCQALEWTHLIHEGMRPFFNPFVLDAQGVLHVAQSAMNPDTGMREIITNSNNQFIDMHGVAHSFGEGINQSGGPKTFGALFFGITGFHGFHVFTGICLNILLLVKTLSGAFERRGHYEMVEKIGLYWHFVDLVWIFVFLVFYLL